MHRLNAIEFINEPGATPSMASVRRGELAILQFGVAGWVGWSAPAPDLEILALSKDDLVIEHATSVVHRCYWDGDMPPWILGVDIQAEVVRHATERAALLGDV